MDAEKMDNPESMEDIDLEALSLAVVGDRYFQETHSILKLDELIKTYPNGVTVNGAYGWKFSNKIVPTFMFIEDESKVFYATAGDLGKLYEKYVDICGGDESKVCRLLQEKPIKMLIKKVKMKNGNWYTQVIIVKEKNQC